ncbi:MAG: hypothetical protein OXT09_34875 [Myxococcales bacterium]|nr:hypothetical protein [Myxococcales bacterium]
MSPTKKTLCTLFGLLVLTGGCKLNATIDDNHPPVAMAGLDQELAFAGTPVTVNLDGRGSSDIDGRLTQFIWRSVDPAIVHPPPMPTTTVTLGEGRYGFNLWVRDNNDAFSDVDQVVIAVGVPLDGPLSGTGDPAGMAGAAAPDPSMFMPDPACMAVNSDMNAACAACTCSPNAMGGCSEQVVTCSGDPLCQAVFECSNVNMCNGSACYTGGCMAEIDTASGGDPLNNCDATMPASSACAAAGAISACKAESCAAACGL